MAGARALAKVQMGAETVAGTAVAADFIWRGGIGFIEDARTVEVFGVDEFVGIATGTNRTSTPKFEALCSMDSGPANYEQLPHVLAAGVVSVAGVVDGTGSDYIYTYTIPTTTQPTIATYTIETGDNQQATEMEYSFVESFTLEGSAGEAMMLSADWRGRQATNTTFTGALSVPTVDEILFQEGVIYIDDVGSGFGATQVSNTLLTMSLSYTTGIMAKWAMDGQKYFSFHQFTRPEITLDMTFEHNGSAVTEMTKWRSETPRAIRVQVTGPAVTTPGTTYSNKTLQLNLAGVYTAVSAIGETDGNDTLDFSFRVAYDSTLATAGSIVVVNELAALP